MFKDIFNQLLQKRNITAYKLSQDTGVTQGMISYWKKGERIPSAEYLVVVANYFDVSVDYLLGRTDNPSPLSKTASPQPEVSYSVAGQAELNQIFLSLNAEGRERLVEYAVMLSTQDRYLDSPRHGLKNA